MHRSGPQFRYPQPEILALVHQRRFAPCTFQYFDRLRHPLAAVIAAHTMTNEFVFVVNCAFPNPYVDPTLAQIVEQCELHCETNG